MEIRKTLSAIAVSSMLLLNLPVLAQDQGGEDEARVENNTEVPRSSFAELAAQRAAARQAELEAERAETARLAEIVEAERAETARTAQVRDALEQVIAEPGGGAVPDLEITPRSSFAELAAERAAARQAVLEEERAETARLRAEAARLAELAEAERAETVRTEAELETARAESAAIGRIAEGLGVEGLPED